MMPKPRQVRALVAILVLAVASLVTILIVLRSPKPSLFEDWQPSASGKLWTATGDPHSPYEALVEPTGAFQPGMGRYSAHFYVYDRDARRLLMPRFRHRTLVDGYLPAPRVTWTQDGIRLRSTVFALLYGGRDTCFSEAVITNTSRRPRSVSFFAAILPYEINGALHGRSSISFDRELNAVVMNGRPFLLCPRPGAFGAVWCDPRRGGVLDSTSFIRDGAVPRDASAPAVPKGMTSAALKYAVDLQPGESRTLRFSAPLGDSKPVPISELPDAYRKFRETWKRELGRVELALPDKRYADCFRASLAYLLILSDGGLPRPGPTKYELFWIRDFAYIADALYYAGRGDLVPPGIAQLKQMQLPNGGFSPTTGSSLDDEYDSPGQAIYTIVQRYKRTGDRGELERCWPGIRAAAEYIRSLRSKNRYTDPERRGILPPSRSAEDIGRPTIQHYWDDFWCVRGLRDAAVAADALGHLKDAAWMRAEAESLLTATWSSIKAVAAKHRISYIPNGPEDVRSSAMARGTSCGVWPCEVLEASEAFARKSFDAYWAKWIAPNYGGFEHNGRFWPYAGLDLAHCYLDLGQRERMWSILKWTVEHDPTHGFFSYPEGMNTRNLTLAVGDMPHGWLCASYISLVRDMIVREDGDRLLLLSGVPREWLAPGKRISARNLPTLFGPVSFRVNATRAGIRVTINRDAHPPGGYGVALPKGIKAIGLVEVGR